MTSRIPIYVSGASREAARARSAVAALEGTGVFAVADRWFDDAEVWTGRDATHSRDAALAISAAHERAMRDAVVFWLLWPRSPTYGALYELGYAACHRWHMGWSRLPHLMVTGPGSSDSVYTAAADYRDESDDLGLHEAMRVASVLTRGQRP